jgi:hypothetical protein
VEGIGEGQAAPIGTPFGGLPSVRIEVVQVDAAGRGPPAFALRVTNSQGVRHHFGRDADAEKLVERWAFDACVFALAWSQPAGTHPIPEAARGRSVR